jgi:flavin reductase (DIM6/NTAB) family NADH-FMN oxidoreductase RutF
VNKQDKTRELRLALGSFPTGVTVVTCLDSNNKPLGFTANSFTSVSLDPQLISICIDKGSFNIDSFSKVRHFAVSVLSEEQQSISTTFATPNEDRFKNINWESSNTGSPIISGAVAWFDCNTEQVINAGDHLILIGKVVAFDSSPKTPLMYLRGNYVNLGLEQKMLLAMENKNTTIIVGAIIEWRKKVLLLQDKSNGLLYFPSDSRLGHMDDKNSLLGRLKNLNISINEHYLFSVFENTEEKASLIYYRAQLKEESKALEEDFYDFDSIPFDKLTDEASRIMLKRYIKERELNAFGIFVGKESEGKVEALSKTNQNL